MITDQVINATCDFDLVVADLTGANANVFYELGVRHSAGGPVVHMIMTGHEEPFDVAGFRDIKFSYDHPDRVDEAVASLHRAVEEIEISDSPISNPVSTARGMKKLMETGDDKDQVVANLIEELDQVKAEVREVKRDSM